MDITAVGEGRLPGNGKTKTGPPRVARSGRLGPVKGFEDLLQFGLRYAGPPIENQDGDPGAAFPVTAFRPYGDRSPFGSVPEPVADDVLHGPPDQFAVKPHRPQVVGVDEYHIAFHGPRFEVRVLRDGVEDRAKVRFFEIHVLHLRLEPRQGEQIPYHVVQDLRFTPYPVQGLLRHGPGLLPRQFERNAETGEGGAQLVGDVPDEALLGFKQGRQVLCHGLETTGQLPYLVGTFFDPVIHRGIQAAARDGTGGPAQSDQGVREVPCEQEAKHEGCGEQPQEVDRQGLGVARQDSRYVG